MFFSICLIIIIFILFFLFIKNKNEESFTNINSSYMCKNIGWKSNSIPYLTEDSKNWYDAIEKCKNDNECNSFCFYGNSSQTSGRVEYFNDVNPIKVESNNWSASGFPNLYIKSINPCVKTTTIKEINDLTTANLKDSSGILDNSYNFENDFILKTRILLNDNNNYKLEKKINE